jgi:hypothetical protein
MRRLLFDFAAAGVLFVAAFSCGASSRSGPAPIISGLLIYSTDDFGNPNRFDSEREVFVPDQLWRTRLGDFRYGLGILRGLPPDSVSGPLLNAPDFSAQIPLLEGENDFTLVGEPRPLTAGDQYARFALNMYFDGSLDKPGISVLFPRHASRGGSIPDLNRSDLLYSLSLDQLTATAETSYTNGSQTVSVTTVSFLPPQESGFDVDLVSAHAPVASGSSDWVGTLRIDVRD